MYLMKSLKSRQLFSSIGLKFDTTTTENKRARLNTGFLCNYNCEFCYYKDRLDQRDSLETIKDRIDDIYNYDIRQIDLSGGESSIEPNWFNILDYCMEKDMYISTISHGGHFHKKEFVQKSIDHGLKEIMFSLHGSNAEVHDKIVQRKSAFTRIIQAIRNAKEAGLLVRINCTVYDLNHEYLKTEYITLLKELEPHEVNFICLNYDTDNSDFRQIDYSIITESIKYCIDNVKDTIKYINVRYVPYCYMIGYEKYVVNYYQHIYDIYDWNLAVYNHEINTSVKYTREEKLRHSYDAARDFRTKGYFKDEGCEGCKFYYICDGIENQLTNNKCMPQEGDKINDINYYRQGFYEA